MQLDALVATVDVVGIEAQLGADEHVGPELGEHAPEVAFGLAVAVLRGRVEIGDAQLDGALGGAHALARLATDHQPADVAAAEADFGDLLAGSAKCPLFHHVTPLPSPP